MNTVIKLSAISLIALSSIARAAYDTPSAATSMSHAWKAADSSKGKIFTDPSGKSLYTFKKDTSGVSNCDGACATAWPPFAAKAGASTKGAWTIVSRKDGSQQWALNGMPLYYFAADKAAGDVRGDGIGGIWDLARPAKASMQTPSTSTY
ncbi:COG4315 family predicted lipoprotein [Leucothrix arctica]|uniref:ATP-binding protein n=1 Tax=Leucothrix arctica TaxID=1481894 RepID=A0A317C3A6_9GAMM|nr:hypothetical protein [Leucothrix arctica]PWQ93186.1 hypothetical protein DKT75_21100 [Leucothrix arctica]